MDPEEQITAIRDILSDDVFAIDKVNRIEDIIPPITPAPITPAELAAAYNDGHRHGVKTGRHELYIPILVYSIICAIGGGLIGMAVV